MAGWSYDLKSAARALLRRPGFALAAILTLALGVGANVALFTGVNAVLLKAYPYRAPDRLFVAYTTSPERPDAQSPFSWQDAEDLRERAAEVLDLAVWDWEPFSLAGGDRPQRVGGGQVTANFASVIGVEMLAGRFFTEEEASRAEPVIVLKEGLWRSSFGADPAIVGRTVLLDGAPVTVVGVAPDSLDAIDNCWLFRPLQAVGRLGDRGSHWLGGYARLRDGVSREQARQRLATAAARLGAEYPETNAGRGADLLDLHESRVGEVRTMFLLLQGVVMMVLLIVCANVANLLLTRGAARREELGVRAALGAGRVRLVRLLMAEAVWLGVGGLALGWLVGVLGARGLFSLLPPDVLPSWIRPTPDFHVLLYAFLVSALAVVLFGALPALHQSRSLAGVARSGRALGGRTRGVLVVAEVALSCLLLLASGLMLRSLLRLTENDPGFRTRGALLVGLDLLSMRNQPAPERVQRFLEYYRRFERIPGVVAVGAVDRIPLGGSSNTVGVTVETPGVAEYDPYVLSSRVTPGYFAAMGLPLLQGSDFELEAASADPAEVVVSRKLADAYWPGESPIGKRLKFGRPDDDAPWFVVRGVVPDVLHRGLDRAPMPTVYYDLAAVGMARAQWVLRSERDPEALAQDVRSAVAEIDPNQPLWGVGSLEHHVERSAWQPRFFTTTFWVFAGLAMLLAAVGLYAALGYQVTQRRQEIGLRVALGATGAKVARGVVRQGMALVAAGLAIGLPLAILAGFFLQGLLYGVDRFDGLVLSLVTALLLLVGLVAVALPAHRAARLDPVATLRSDG